MAQTCGRCSRINPAEAAYCYHDGTLLGNSGRASAAVRSDQTTFNSPFIFPSGRVARDFDELALGCQAEWTTARDLLLEGRLESFLEGLGRADLALGAREAAYYPDPDRGLDQFLARLPTRVLEPPRLRVNPLEVSLGVVPAGEERRFELHLENQGMRLLYGSVSSEDCPWLSLGGSTSGDRRLFQFQAEKTFPVHILGKCLRASNKPLKGRLTVESNGGSTSVLVRVDVPVHPFAEGVLAGATSPRQVAEKATAAPKDAARLFEGGAVARWYDANGWTYPIAGPMAKGLAAVQQYFEALGLTPPPKVQIREAEVILRGNPGEALRHYLEVYADENRPIYAHAASDQNWLNIGRSRPQGRTVRISLKVPSVPNCPGEILNATVIVRANGNQRFYVPVTLLIGGPSASVSLNGLADRQESCGLPGWRWLRRLWSRRCQNRPIKME
ncbi:MAG: hypothetical protein ACJ8FY_08255 [Gemmataceae bacterium]